MVMIIKKFEIKKKKHKISIALFPPPPSQINFNPKFNFNQFLQYENIQLIYNFYISLTK